MSEDTQHDDMLHLRRDMVQMKEDITQLRSATKELVDAWKAAGTFLKFMKFMSAFATGAAACWALIQLMWHTPK